MTKRKLISIFVAAIMALSVLCIAFAGCGSPLKSISITGKPTKTDYVVGQTLDLTGLEVTAKFEDGSEKVLSGTDYTVEPAAGTKLTAENKEVVIKYKSGDVEKTGKFSIKVHNNIVSLAVKTAPAKTTYWGGEAFDPAGMVLTATYENGDTQDVTVAGNTNVTCDKTTLTTTTDADETQTLTFTHGGQTVTQDVTVKYNPVETLTVRSEPTKTEYYPGEKFDPAGMVLTATYRSGTVSDITVASDASVSYKTTELSESDANFTVSFGGKSVTVALTFLEGIFIEAETGDIVSTTVDINTNAVRKAEEGELADSNGIAIDEAGNQINTASGGKYIGDLKSGDTVTFMFDSNQAGDVTLNFRMASQYLKADQNWTPIWMGDCQFNKICNIYVNDVLYPVSDDVILPGGGSENGSTDATLWYNWQDVPVENVAVQAGRNTIKLEFITHDYTDTSQSSFSGKFTANIDCLNVLAPGSGLEMTPYNYNLVSHELSLKNTENFRLENRDGKAWLIVDEGVCEYTYTGYTADEVVSKIAAVIQPEYTFDLQTNPNVNGSGYSTVLSGAHTVNVSGNTFELAVNLSSLTTRAYTTHLNLTANNTGASGWSDYKPGIAYDQSVGAGNRVYRAVSIPGSSSGSDFWGCLGIYVYELNIAAYPDSMDDPTFAGLKLSYGDVGGTAELTPESEGVSVSRTDDVVTATYTQSFGEGEAAYDVTCSTSYTVEPVGMRVISLPTDVTDTTDYAGLSVGLTYVNGETKAVSADDEDLDVSYDETTKLVTIAYGDFAPVAYLADNSDAPAASPIGEQEWNDPTSKDMLDAAAWDTASESHAGAPAIDSAAGTVTFTSASWARWNILTVKHVSPSDQSVAYNNIGAEVQGRVDGQEFMYSLNVKATSSDDSAANFNLGLLLANGFVGDMSGAATTEGIMLGFDGNQLRLRTSEGRGNNVLATAVTTFAAGENNRIDFSLERNAHKVTLKLWINGHRVYWNEGAMSAMANGSLDEDGNFTFMAGKAQTDDGETSGYNNYGNRLGVYAGDNTTVVLSKVSAEAQG